MPSISKMKLSEPQRKWHVAGCQETFYNQTPYYLPCSLSSLPTLHFLRGLQRDPGQSEPAQSKEEGQISRGQQLLPLAFRCAWNCRSTWLCASCYLNKQQGHVLWSAPQLPPVFTMAHEGVLFPSDCTHRSSGPNCPGLKSQDMLEAGFTPRSN